MVSSTEMAQSAKRHRSQIWILGTRMLHDSKLWTHNSTRKESEYRKYLTPGGYPYYWSMKAGAEVLTSGGDLERALSVVEGLTRESERVNNAYGIKTLAELLAEVKGKCFQAPRGSVSSPLGHLTIKVEPEFGIELENAKATSHSVEHQDAGNDNGSSSSRLLPNV
jgi:hypothetical protein